MSREVPFKVLNLDLMKFKFYILFNNFIFDENNWHVICGSV